MVVMHTKLPSSPRHKLIEGAIHEAIRDRGGDGEWGIDLHFHENRCLSLTITGPIGAWYKTFYEKDRVAIGRIKATVQDEIDRRLA
jgi:hypothetical protein